jgi:hypothetical protein
LPHFTVWQSPLLITDNQLIEHWIALARPTNQANEQPASLFDVGLEDIIKLLIVENEMEILLMLAHHSKISIDSLHLMSHGHSFGWNRLQDYPPRAYIFFNVVACKPEIRDACAAIQTQLRGQAGTRKDISMLSAPQKLH